MPDRVIRDELLTSERYWSVGIEAQRLFVHLLLNADALGRFSGKNYTIRAACYPGIAVDPKLVEKLLSDLNDADLIRIYEDGKEGRHIFIPRYKQRLKAKGSYYPAPPKAINDIDSFESASSPPEGGIKAAEGIEGSKTLLQQPKPDPRNAATWSAFASAYASRYGVPPVRNASVNTCIANIVKRLGDESPQVASFYLTHNDQFYIKKQHSVKQFLADCEGLRTQWKRGRKVTTLEARSAEQQDSLREQIKRLNGD